MAGSHILLNEWLVIEGGASGTPPFTPGLYKQPVRWDGVIWQMTIVCYKDNGGYFPRDFFFKIFFLTE